MALVAVNNMGPEVEAFGFDVPSSLGSLDEEQERREVRMYNAMDGMPADIRRWTVGDTCSWLASIGLEEYISRFVYHEISGAVLCELNRSVLREEVGVERVGHIWHILKARDIVLATMRAGRRLEYPDLVGWGAGGGAMGARLALGGADAGGSQGGYVRGPRPYRIDAAVEDREADVAKGLAGLAAVTGFMREVQHFFRGGLLHQLQTGLALALGLWGARASTGRKRPPPRRRR